MENFAGAPAVRCRGGDSQARPRSGIRTAKSMPCTVPCARPLMCHCEERSDVAISGRQLQPVQAIADRMQYCRGGDSRTRHCTGGKCGLMLKRQWPPSLSLRGGQRPTWQSHATDYVFAWAFLISDMVLRDCHGPFGPRNDKSGSHHRFSDSPCESFVQRRARLSAPLHSHYFPFLSIVYPQSAGFSSRSVRHCRIIRYL